MRSPTPSCHKGVGSPDPTLPPRTKPLKTMGRSVTEFIPFIQDRYPRYNFDLEAGTIYDTKFKRNIVAGCKRGGEPHYRLVDLDDQATHVLATSVFGDRANLIDVDTDFEPSDFSDRYAFDPDPNNPQVIYWGDKGPIKKGSPMTLLTPNGWAHWFLRRNDGQRVRVTPAEILKAYDRDEWEVAPPKGSKVVTPLFANYAFTPDGQVWTIKSDKPLLRPEPVPLFEIPCPGSKHPDREAIYQIRSQVTNKYYRFTRQSIKDVFKSKLIK